MFNGSTLGLVLAAFLISSMYSIGDVVVITWVTALLDPES